MQAKGAQRLGGAATHLLLHERLVGCQQAAQGGGVQAAQRLMVLLLLLLLLLLRRRRLRRRRGRRGAHLRARLLGCHALKTGAGSHNGCAGLPSTAHDISAASPSNSPCTVQRISYRPEGVSIASLSTSE